MNGTRGLFILVFVLAQLGFTAASQRDFTKETPEQRAKRLEWFNEARFGMFIHWGLYAVPGGEWNGKFAPPGGGEWIMETMKIPIPDYAQLVPQFNPVQFDAHKWVRIAKDAGMKYIVITSKHHDGFGLWRSDLTDWCIKSTPFQRDPLRELADACRAAGLKLCFYHSIMDWHHPDYANRRKYHHLTDGQPDMDRYVEYMKGQLKELLTRYGPIGILWFDGEWEKAWTHERGVDLYNYVRSLQPDIIVNNRVGKGRAGMAGMDQGQGVGDYGTPEQEIPATGFGPGVTWESCMTMNGTWGYRKDDHDWKSATVLVRNLIDCASKGGNYLLNVGPTGAGLIPESSVERLIAMGHWMKVNRESIYGTKPSPFKRLPWGRCTTKSTGRETTLYLHIFDWPKDGKLFVPGLLNVPRRAYLLSDTRKLPLTAASIEDGLVLSVPLVTSNAISTTVVLKFREPLWIQEHGLAQAADGTIMLSAAEATLHGGLRLETHSGVENIGYWTNPQDSVEWEFKVTRPGRFEVGGSFAAESASAIEFRVGQQTLRGNIGPTGSYRQFHDLSLGVLEFPARGKVSLTVRGVKSGWQPVNVKSLSLRPVQ